MKKTVVSVDLYCDKCKQKVMQSVSKLEGVTSIALDVEKNTVTVIGVADPVRIMGRIRKLKKVTAHIVSVGPKEEEKKKQPEKKDEDAKPKPTPEIVYVTPYCSYAPCICGGCCDGRCVDDGSCCIM